ncbi:VOC family protein [Robertkochia flava]|uniref:VOC family protein n=1 Tax=Robertkochia flava TaxID=3447986 RepID=UPI001CCEC369|nr:VOC family protein [Robertkochia marina]
MKLKNHLKCSLAVLLFLSLTAFDLSPEPARPITSAENFIWHDLVTPDLDSSMAFYSAVFGWTFKDVEVKGLRLATIYSGDMRIGGVIEVPGANSAVWIKAILVDNLKKRVDIVQKSGGRVVLPPAEIPGRGTQVIMEGADGEEFSFIGNADAGFAAGMVTGNNHWLWSELWADSPESSQSFYEAVFGVNTESTSANEKPYWVFHSGDTKLAGMIQNPITNEGTQWVPYVQSEDPPGSIAKAKEEGAFIVLEPAAEVRNGNVGIFQDPQGAMVCVQKR